jgi:hypothetical protein
VFKLFVIDVAVGIEGGRDGWKDALEKHGDDQLSSSLPRLSGARVPRGRFR